MDENFVVVGDGDEEHTCSYVIPDHATIVEIQTEQNPLDPNHEHAYLSGMCDVIRDLGYGMMDLRRLEENIAAVHGHYDSKFKHAWDSAYTQPLVADSVPVELVFIGSQKRVKSPCMVPHLPEGYKLVLLSNLKDREVALTFAKSLLKQQKSGLPLSLLEKAVLAELSTQSGE